MESLGYAIVMVFGSVNFMALGEILLEYAAFFYKGEAHGWKLEY